MFSFHFVGPPPECRHSGVGVVREEQWGSTSPTDHSNTVSPPPKSPQPPPSTISPRADDHQRFVSLSDTTVCEVLSNVSSDLSLFDIEKDCQLDPEVYDITDLAEASKSMLVLPKTDLNAVGRKKSPRLKKKQKVDQSAKDISKGEKKKSVEFMQQELKKTTIKKCSMGIQDSGPNLQTTTSTCKDIKSSDSLVGEIKQDEIDGHSKSKKLIQFNPEDLESDSTDSSQETDLASVRNKISPEGLGEGYRVIEADQRESRIDDEDNKENVEEVEVENNGLDDSGKHDSFDSLLESSLFQNHRLSSIDDRKNRFESVESFNLSPLTPLSGSKIETKAQTYTFAFVNDSVWTNESSDNVAPSEDDFDEIFNKAVVDLDTSQKKLKPAKPRRKKSHQPSVDSNKELEEIKENVEDALEDDKVEGNRRSFQMEFGNDHEFKFSTDDVYVEQEGNGVEPESRQIILQKQNETANPSLLWRFEDSSLKDEFHQVFGAQEQPQKQTYAQNRAFLRKTFATSTESVSTESDALSVIHEEIDSSDQSNEDMEDGREMHLQDIQEEDDSSMLTEGTVELCVEKNVQELYLHKQDSIEPENVIVDDSEGIDENITVYELKTKSEMKEDSDKITLDSCLEDHSSTDPIGETLNESEKLETLKDEYKSPRDNLGKSNDQSKEMKGVDYEMESSLSMMLLASSKIAMMTLETSESPADKSIHSTEELVSSLDADICLDEESSQASEDHLLQQIIHSQCNSEDLSMQDSSPDSQTEKVRKRDKSKQLVQEWLQTDVEGVVMEDTVPEIPDPPLVHDWLGRKVLEGVDPAPVPAPLSLPLSEGGQSAADSYPTTAPTVPVLQLEGHSGILLLVFAPLVQLVPSLLKPLKFMINVSSEFYVRYFQIIFAKLLLITLLKLY